MLMRHRDGRLRRWFNRWRGSGCDKLPACRSGDGATIRANRARQSFRPCLEQLEERRLLYAGMLDHAFGTDGMASIDLLGISNQLTPLHATSVVLQSDGKIVIGGYLSSGGANNAVIARLNPDGSLDTTFNSGVTPGLQEQLFIGTSPFPVEVALQSNGQIVVATTNTNVQGLFLTRLNKDGTFDSSFSGGFVGYKDLQDGGSLTANAIAIQPDDKIVVAGSDTFGLNTYFALVRFNADGRVDKNFEFSNAGFLTGQPGLVLTGFTDGYDVANSVAIEPNGTIVAAGSSTLDFLSFAVAVYNPDGTPDADFNAVGRVTTSISNYNAALGVAIQPDGKIVAAGESSPSAFGGGTISLVRYLPDGTLDASFGSGGKVLTPFINNINIGQAPVAVVLQPDSKIVVAGSNVDGPQYGGQNFALARYNSDGSLDNSFSFNGLVTTDLFGGERFDEATALALQPDGKLVAVGNSFDLFNNPIIGVARYDGDAGQLQFSSPSVTVNESAGTATLTVTRTRGATGTVTVDYAVSDGTATNGADYNLNPASGTITFGDGETGKSIPVPILDDGTLEGGTETFRLTLSNPTGGATLGGQTVEVVSIADPDMIVNPIATTEGQSFSGVVATFKGSNPSVPIGDYAASIAWGDNTMSAGTLSADPNGGFDVSGTHTYAEEGNYTVKVSISGADTIMGSAQATVADAPLTAAGVGKIHVTGGVLFSGTVATFNDADPAGTLSDYNAVIDWGDGSPTITGILSGTGPFTVSGSHTYAVFNGTKTITVTITDAGGSKASTTDNVTDPSLPNSIAGFDSQTGQWWIAQPNGSGFTNSMWAAWSPNVTWVDAVSGDFTGSGKTDVAARDLQTGNWWVGVSNGSGFTTSLWTTWSPKVTWVDVKVGDFTGDGKMDIAGRVLQTGQWWVAESTGSGFSNSLWTTWSTAVTWVDVNVGDFDGDGRADIVGRWLQGGQWWVAQSTGSGFTNSLWATWSPLVTWVDVRVGDFTGNGMDDIAGRVLQTGQWWVAESTGASFTNSLWTTWSTAVTWVDVRVGDFTGDGQLDIIGRVLQTGQWWLAQSNGSGFTNHLWGVWSPNVTWVDVQIGDFNGDGKADVAGRALQTGQWWTGLSIGSGFTTSLASTWASTVTWLNVSGGNYA